jgi:hypothetical protein
LSDDPEIRVRIGTPDDVHPMMSIARLATAENGFAEPDDLLLLREIWAALNLEDGIVGIIGDPGKQIEATVLLRIGTPWYSSRTRCLEEKAIFVHPQFRRAKGGRAARLCEFSKRTADTLGLPLTIGVLSNQRTSAKVKMYTRIMGEPSGAYWLYGVKTGAFSPV